MTVQRIVRLLAAWAALAAACCCVGCQASRQVTVADVDPFAWNGPAELLIENTDTTALRDIELFLRCNDRFGEDTLTVRITTLAPDTLRCVELLPIHFPRVTGPASLAREHTVAYRRRIRFSQSGDYRMMIAPTRPVAGVEAVGISIVKSI